MTGATGFVGNLVAWRLVADGHHVIGTTRGSWKPRVPPKGVEPAFPFEMIHHGVFDALVHAAGPSNVRICHEQPVVVGDALKDWARLLERAWENRARVVLLSSHSVYGRQEVQPISETAALHPRSIYGAMKAAQEQLAMAFHHAKGLPVVVLRCATLVGGAERPDALVRRITESAMGGTITLDGDGSQTRDLLDVNYVVEAIARALVLQEVVGETYNIGSGVAVPITELAFFVTQEAVIKTGWRAAIVQGPPRAHEEGPLALAIDKAIAAKLLPDFVGRPLDLDWNPEAWRHAVSRTVAWCLENHDAT